jgi:hypothetical protein
VAAGGGGDETVMRSLAFITAGLGLALAACSGGSGGYVPPVAEPGLVQTVGVDTGEQLVPNPGGGAGVFVEYAAGGTWHVFTTCDTTQSNFTCGWDLVASIDRSASLSVTEQAEVDKGDQVLRVDKGAVRLLFDTAMDVDGVHLSAPPGKSLELDVILDGNHDASLVSWVTGGAVHLGAPSDPIQFAPTAP